MKSLTLQTQLPTTRFAQGGAAYSATRVVCSLVAKVERDGDFLKLSIASLLAR